MPVQQFAYTSDSDFTRLATRLRESGKTVYGLGLRKTPQSLVAACDIFIYLEVLGERDEPSQPDEPDDAGEAHLSAIGSYLRSADSSFDPRLHGFPKLVALVEAQPYLTTTGSGSGVRVGLKGKATPASAPTRKTAAKKSRAQPSG
ncbi:NYN domain-containing protein [Pimelobacter simplex]|uniref:Maebl n=1 Tax=Nocardioides simplex TaxID=2045 RepID=A0A0C5XMJ0_NOCSI|nr:OST-HTH/LOTUS domain-containing protein [Pimelobacter simplex]AJR18677.1 Maebl [Pimelobacter simplex]GEB14429.1 hypothetical protein NSI01_27440 [Pimelobacter simplex]